MTDAFVNVVVDVGAISAAATEIDSVEAVTETHVVTGEFDVVAQVELADSQQLPTVVADEIHPITGVVDTVTHVAFEP